MTLQVPQTRDGSFSPEIFKRYPRSEQTFVLALMEMALCGASFSKSTVIALGAHLDPRVRAFNERCLTAPYPFMWVDALGLTVREDTRGMSKAVLLATGIRDDGGQEVRGLEIGGSEPFAPGRIS